MDDVQCVGTEQSLFDCNFLSTHNCIHQEDASVVCLQTPGMHASYAINIVTVSMLLFMSFFSQLL